MSLRWIVALLAAFCFAASAPAAESKATPASRPDPIHGTLFVALRINLQRTDIRVPGVINWLIPPGDTASRQFDDVTVMLSAPNGITTAWWTRGDNIDAPLCSSGVLLKQDSLGPLRMTFHGLKPGRHTLVTYHSSFANNPFCAFDLIANGQIAQTNIQPSQKPDDDADVAQAFCSFIVQPNQDVTIEFKPTGGAGEENVIVNAFALDAVNPRLLPTRPQPDDGDQHVAEKPIIKWTPAPNATAQLFYIGKDKTEVDAAGPGSPQARPSRTAASYTPGKLSTLHDYYWRVDQVIPGQPQPIRGPIWSFRVRHLAFPGAEGYGRFAIGGRGGRVIEVTSLADSGPGTLREAVDAEGPRTVVFRIGGDIHLQSPITVQNPYITIAGQTAPGDGIQIDHYKLGVLGSHDVIIRFIRIRVGDASGVTQDGSGMGRSCNNCIMDHCSIAWSIDESFSSRATFNITLQRTLITEALNLSIHSHYLGTDKGHSFAGSISGNIGSFHHNLIANCSGRNWSLAGGLTRDGKYDGYLDIRNNVVFNFVTRTNDGGAKAVNLVGNFYIPGPATKIDFLLNPDVGSAADPQQYYVYGNEMENRPQYTNDNWNFGCVKVKPGLMSQIRLDQPFCESYVTTQSAEDAYQSIIRDVGDNIPRPDSIDTRAITDVVNRTFTVNGSKSGLPGIIDSQNDVGGYIHLQGGPAPLDTDHDGIPDDWERSHGLNPNDPSDAAKDSAGDGYTNLERYLNWIVENHGLTAQ